MKAEISSLLVCPKMHFYGFFIFILRFLGPKDALIVKFENGDDLIYISDPQVVRDSHAWVWNESVQVELGRLRQGEITATILKKDAPSGTPPVGVVKLSVASILSGNGHFGWSVVTESGDPTSRQSSMGDLTAPQPQLRLAAFINVDSTGTSGNVDEAQNRHSSSKMRFLRKLGDFRKTSANDCLSLFC